MNKETTTQNTSDLETLATAALDRMKQKNEEAEDATDETIDNEENRTSSISKRKKKPTVKVDDDDDDVTIITSGNAEDQVEIDSSNYIHGLDMNEIMPDMPEAKRVAFLSEINPEIEEYRKELMINDGFTSREATQAARNRFKRKAADANSKYLEDNPKVGIIEIDAKNQETFEVPEEFENKLHKVHALKLVIVENKELETLNILKRDEDKKKYKTRLFRGLNHSLSHYSVPMPCMGDYITFNGAQTLSLVSAAAMDDDTIYESLMKKANLIYSQIFDGTCFHKYDEQGDLIVNFSDFCNTFKYDDVDMAIYGIAVASSMEVSEADVKCVNNACKRNFNAKYNIKTLLSLEDVNEYYKNRIELIDSYRNQPEKLQQLIDDHNKELRVKSPVTENVYTLSFPSISRALKIFEHFNGEDIKQYGTIMCATYLSEIFIYDEEENGYHEVDMDDIDEVTAILTNIPQIDLNMVSKQLTDRLYVPKFVFKTKCPHCKNENTETLNIDQLLFLKARDTSMEIK